MRNKVAFFFIVLSLIASVSLTYGQKKKKKLPVVRIGTVIDGQWERLGEIRRVFEKEILELTGGEFDVLFPEEKHIVGDFTNEGINSVIDRLLDDTEVDLILAIGPLSSHEISRRKELSKPVIAPFVLDPEIQKLPLEGDASGVNNLSYITFPAHIVEDIELFRKIVPFTKLAMLLSRAVHAGIPELHANILKELGEMGLEVTIVPVGASTDKALASMPSNVQAVYLAPLIHLI
ncbi:MAG: hypothetical protein O7D34_06975 [Ignavibacteria bacterium]|nr:hypothetical protein [Ignavibacteria bacterium]